MYTASAAFLDSLQEAGVSCVFANPGSDHPALIEAIAAARWRSGSKRRRKSRRESPTRSKAVREEKRRAVVDARLGEA